MNNTLIFKGRDDVQLLAKIRELRLNVWRRLLEAEVVEARFDLDDFDYQGWHVVHFFENKLIGSGRLVIAENQLSVPDLCSFKSSVASMRFPTGILNRLVVDHNHVGNGIAALLSAERIKFAQNLGVCELWVEVEQKRVHSMQDLGFIKTGVSEDFSIQGAWYLMRKSFN